MKTNLFDLNGKVVLIIGGRGFLGRHFCSCVANAGGEVYSADIAIKSNAARSNFKKIANKEVVETNVDATDPISVNSLVESIISRSLKIDVLIYSVTLKPDDFYKPFTECSLDGWQKVLHTELDGLFLTSQAVGRYMEIEKSGSLIFVSSIYGIVGNDQRIYKGSNLPGIYSGKLEGDYPKKIYSHAAYNASKGALISLCRYLAAYWGSYGIRVNCISPGGISHPGENELFVKKYSHRVPLGRKAALSDLEGAIIYLASDASNYVTGHNLVVDGGWTIW